MPWTCISDETPLAVCTHRVHKWGRGWSVGTLVTAIGLHSNHVRGSRSRTANLTANNSYEKLETHVYANRNSQGLLVSTEKRLSKYHIITMKDMVVLLYI